ncbi:polysaccharide deacetylase family protein [Gracilibacillus caseinilyticus]|uniref:Polysaccharide deacetylase family protein n=1 Tax=Gracilibacillus caseinilyticus TaxID=2932256 RepID=A0ABY4F0X9_9BACI|nr:polysaccharide deacetylase family protein [Gracilibacillus caseinilyticus]UOQ49742.1 polysaccharide deacetylase family protein [Gracilibacillus caseinilyticus]
MLPRVFLFLGISLLLTCNFPITSHAQSTKYPLQAKFPNLMLYEGEVDEKIIALTFDDGPDQRYTPEILDILKKNQVKATFFLVGTRVEKHVEIAKRIVSEGHAIGNHTFWHPNLAESDIQKMQWEIRKTSTQILHATGQETSWFRAPYGALNEKQVLTLGNLGYKGIGWSLDTEDWRSPGESAITNQVINHVHPGAIILMHSAGHWTQDLSGTVDSVSKLIPTLKKHGYQFVTIPDLWELSQHK